MTPCVRAEEGVFFIILGEENRCNGTDILSSRNHMLHIHVMDQSQSRMWHQPMRPLREWYQEELIIQVQEAAEEAGRKRALLYDSEETLLWQSSNA